MTLGSIDFGGGSSSPAFDPFPSFTKPKRTSLTKLQKLQLEFLQKQAQPHHSLLSKIFHGGVHGLESGLQFIARPSYAIAGGALAAEQGKSIGHAALQGIEGKTHTGFGQVLDEAGILKHHNFLRGLAGFGLDVATDPTMLASIAAAPVTGGASLSLLATRAAELGIGKDVLGKASQVALRSADLASKGKIGAKGLVKSRRILTLAGKGFENQNALVKHVLAGVDKTLPRDAEYYKQLHSLQELATISHKSALGPKYIHVGFKVPGMKSTHPNISYGTFFKKTPIKAPSLLGASGSKTFGKLTAGVGPKAALRIGRAFKPGFEDPEGHAIISTQRRIAQRTHDVSSKLLADTFKPFNLEHGSSRLPAFATRMAEKINRKTGDRLTQREVLDALDIGETASGIVRGVNRKLNIGMLRNLVARGVLSKEQAKFLAAWHSFTEHLRRNDIAAGLPYDKNLKDVIYVPHVYTTEGLPISTVKSLLTKPGYTYDRLSKRLTSAKLLKELYDKGLYRKEIETNPLRLLAIRASRGARADSESTARKLVAKTVAIPSKVRNYTAIAKQMEEITKRHAAQDALVTLQPGMLQKLHNQAFQESHLKWATEFQKAKARNVQKSRVIKSKIRNLKKQIKEFNRTFKPKKPDFYTGGGKDKYFTVKGDLLTHGKDIDRMYARAGVRGANDEIRHNLYTKDHKLIGTAVYAHIGFGKRIYVEHIYIKPEYRGNLQALHTLLNPILKHGKPIEAQFDNIKLGKIFEKKLARGELKPIPEFTKEQRAAVRPKPVMLHAHLGIQLRALARNNRDWGQKMLHLEKKRELDHARRLLEIEAQHEKEYNAVLRHQKAIVKAEGKIKYHATSGTNPEAMKPNMKILSSIKDKNGNPMAVPVEIATSLARAEDSLTNDAFLREFNNVWKRTTARWKIGVTSVNPGYRARNTVSDLWNMYVRGVPLWAISRYGASTAYMMKKALRNGEPKAVERFNEAYDHGILAGLFQGDVEKLMRAIHGTTVTKRASHPLRQYVNMMTTFNRHAENWGRLTHYNYLRDHLHMTAADAAHQVRETHFDYEDLTKTERSLKSNLVPFYTWTRKNVPFQITSMLQRPGRFSAFPKLMNEMQTASGDPSADFIMPSWMKQQLAFRVPFGGKNNTFIPQFGPTDIAKMEHPSQLLQMITPLIKTPAELAINRSLLTGAPIHGKELTHPRNPTSELGKLLFQHVPGSNVGQTSRLVQGKKVTGPGANPIFSYLAGQEPIPNFLINQRSNIKAKQRGEGKAELSYLGGLSTYAPDPEQQLSAERFVQQEGFKQFLRGLRDEGKLKEPKKKKKSSKDNRFDKLLQEIANQ